MGKRRDISVMTLLLVAFLSYRLLIEVLVPRLIDDVVDCKSSI